MSLDSLRIVADERERKSGIPQLLKKAGLDLEVKTLPVGDYIVSSETVVERKSIQDLVSSVFDGRLFDQCSRLREHYAHPILALEGNPEDLADILENPLVFYGAVSSAALDYNVSVISTPDAEHTARLLASMAARRGASQGPLLKKIRKYQDIQRQQLTVLGSLPGVGETLSQRMLERFGSPMEVLAASTADLAKVPGLGRARAQRIRRVLEEHPVESSNDNQKRLE